MTDTPLAIQPRPRSVHDVLFAPSTRGVLIAASKNPDAKLTFIVTPPAGVYPSGPLGPVAVKIPATAAAGGAVEHEGRVLVQLHAAQLGTIADTLPRYVETVDSDGLPALVSTALRGTPMSVGYNHWLHTARPARVAEDFVLAGGWLRRLQAATAGERTRFDWAADVCDSLRKRWPAHPQLDAALVRLTSADHQLSSHLARRTAVHGDYWFGNLLVADGTISGVVDWEGGASDGWPLRDLVRFALSYSLYLDRHTRPGHRVLGHRGLRRDGFAPGITYALLGQGWLPELVRSFLCNGLTELGLPPDLWYHAAVTGIGEVAALANNDAFGAAHLGLLAGLSPSTTPHDRQEGLMRP
jgi:hypothetical protein